MTLQMSMTRVQLLRYLPKGGVVAEIGVAEGLFSAEILHWCRPESLHLIDPWRHVDDAPNAGLDPNNVPDEAAEARYRSVLRMFDGHPSVQVHRATSAEALERFPDGSLDWVYVDGDHRYAAVRADLELCLRKVRPDGLILGHDFTEAPFAQRLGFGVVPAVNEFVGAHRYEFVAVTDEDFPTFVLTRSQRRAQALAWALMGGEDQVA